MNQHELYQKLHSYTCERYFRVRTTGRHGAIVGERGYYSALPYVVAFGILDQLALTANDILVDVGCGKGRVVCCACRLKIRRVVGLEIDAGLLAEAVANVSRLRGRAAAFEPVAGAAEEYNFADATAVLLFNPFGQGPMSRVIKNLGESFRSRPRRIQVAYANCLHQRVMEEQPWLRKVAEWRGDAFPAFGRPISFWESQR